MKSETASLKDCVRFLGELARNNEKAWMDANRERYRAHVVEPMRALLDRLTAAATKLNPRFVTSGRTGENFSRINRDIRFARDKTPYRPQMYLYFSEPEGEGGQLYAGVSPEAVTCGFRIYGGGKTSPLVQFGRPRGRDNAKWIAQQKRRLAAKFESYWYSTDKGEWTKHKGWPTEPEQWKKLQAWIVRRKFRPTGAALSGLEREAAKVFAQVYPLYDFTSAVKWKA
ncbi:MAG TPA: DUF2461 family protein [Candidatus Limnocylindrales bacterium]|nr:DUF2461 family protein [Candidatus Limnocylindrales bacterium]